jgi:hypothetical protein
VSWPSVAFAKISSSVSGRSGVGAGGAGGTGAGGGGGVVAGFSAGGGGGGAGVAAGGFFPHAPAASAQISNAAAPVRKLGIINVSSE